MARPSTSGNFFVWQKIARWRFPLIARGLGSSRAERIHGGNRSHAVPEYTPKMESNGRKQREPVSQAGEREEQSCISPIEDTRMPAEQENEARVFGCDAKIPAATSPAYSLPERSSRENPLSQAVHIRLPNQRWFGCPGDPIVTTLDMKISHGLNEKRKFRPCNKRIGPQMYLQNRNDRNRLPTKKCRFRRVTATPTE